MVRLSDFDVGLFWGATTPPRLNFAATIERNEAGSSIMGPGIRLTGVPAMSLLVGGDEDKAWGSCLAKGFAMLPSKELADPLFDAVRLPFYLKAPV